MLINFPCISTFIQGKLVLVRVTQDQEKHNDPQPSTNSSVQQDDPSVMCV